MPKILAESIPDLLDAAADEGVAALQVVVEEGERSAEGEAVEPEADLGEFDGHGVEVDAVDAAFEDAALEQVEVGELAHVDADALALHLFLDLVTCLSQFVYNRVPFEGGQDFRHLVGNVVNRLHQEVTAAHGRVEHFQVEKGLVERLVKLFVGFVFGMNVVASQSPSFSLLGSQVFFGFAEDWAQGLQLLLQN
ncbi:MAG TPA: hypothetical protein VEL31_08185, partial [Ktedonobacteraceae bacterium]|nr:hypothetical protein [Ktedonobacteraceae bacterium]